MHECLPLSTRSRAALRAGPQAVFRDKLWNVTGIEAALECMNAHEPELSTKMRRLLHQVANLGGAKPRDLQFLLHYSQPGEDLLHVLEVRVLSGKLAWACVVIVAPHGLTISSFVLAQAEHLGSKEGVELIELLRPLLELKPKPDDIRSPLRHGSPKKTDPQDHPAAVGRLSLCFSESQTGFKTPNSWARGCHQIGMIWKRFSASSGTLYLSFIAHSLSCLFPANHQEEVDVRDVNFNLSSDEEDNGRKDEEEEEDDDPFSGSGTMEAQADGVMALISPHVSNLVHNPSATQVRPTPSLGFAAVNDMRGGRRRGATCAELQLTLWPVPVSPGDGRGRGAGRAVLRRGDAGGGRGGCAAWYGWALHAPEPRDDPGTPPSLDTGAGTQEEWRL